MNDQSTFSSDKQAFAEALAESFQRDRIELGQLVAGDVVAVTGDQALISVGGKTEAIMDAAELGDLRPGDGLEAIVVALEPELKVSHKAAIQRREREALRGAYANKIPVEGKVVGRNKGGYDVSIAGLRAFCPMSQIELSFPRNVDAYLGKTYHFLITEMADGIDTMVVSRAQVLREEREQVSAHAWSAVEPGTVIEGTVKSIRDFGVFVDLGGVDGMVHLSELSHRHGVRPSALVKVGDKVRVKVLEADRDKNRISLSMKALEPDPWTAVPSRYPAGAPFSGAIARKTEFGAFVELEPGIDGLIHVSQLRPGLTLESPEMEVGTAVSGWIRECDPERRRISLTMREMATGDPWLDAASRYPVGALVEGVVERVAAFGAFIEVEPGLTALIPASETDLPRGADLASAFMPGGKISATVLSVDPERKRLSLSAKKAKESKATRDFRKWNEQRQAERQPEVTSFGAALMKALGQTQADKH